MKRTKKNTADEFKSKTKNSNEFHLFVGVEIVTLTLINFNKNVCNEDTHKRNEMITYNNYFLPKRENV